MAARSFAGDQVPLLRAESPTRQDAVGFTVGTRVHCAVAAGDAQVLEEAAEEEPDDHV